MQHHLVCNFWCMQISAEMRSLSELLGPYGMKFLSESLMWHISSQVAELKVFLLCNNNFLNFLTKFSEPKRACTYVFSYCVNFSFQCRNWWWKTWRCWPRWGRALTNQTTWRPSSRNSPVINHKDTCSLILDALMHWWQQPIWCCKI